MAKFDFEKRVRERSRGIFFCQPQIDYRLIARWSPRSRQNFRHSCNSQSISFVSENEASFRGMRRKIAASFTQTREREREEERKTKLSARLATCQSWLFLLELINGTLTLGHVNRVPIPGPSPTADDEWTLVYPQEAVGMLSHISDFIYVR